MQLESISPFAHGLHRPECVLAHSSGLIFVPNWANSGGISIISPTGYSTKLFCADAQKPVKPNGIALEADGHFLLAHLGDEDGGIFRLSPNGNLTSVVTHANGKPLPPTNFVTSDHHGRLWITVSTTKNPRTSDYRATANSGFIALAEPGETDARIVADGLGYANECVVDLDQSAVFVNETFARRLTRFDLASNGRLSNPHLVTQFTAGTYPDGVCADEDGNFWVTSIISNRVIKVSPTGTQTLMFEDSDEQFVAAAESAYEKNCLDSEHLASTGNTVLANITSLAFGGPERKTAYLGNLLGDCLHRFEATVKGKEPVHWNIPLGPWESLIDQIVVNKIN